MSRLVPPPAADQPQPGIVRVLLEPAHLRRTGLTALVVGSWLTAVNQWDVLAAGNLEFLLVIKIVMNYLTPLVVANVGLLSRRPS